MRQLKQKAIIVESPTKTRTLARFLGDDFVIVASSGHVRDLPKGGMAVDVEHDFEPQYVTIPRQQKTLNDLKKKLKNIDEVYLATDPDREGEAIAWHLVEALGLKDARRIEFNEITKDAVLRALEHPGKIDIERVNAQQARRVLDRLVGYKLSPVLWKRIGSRGQQGALSAGRVQSAALRLICDREREVAAFIPEEYWSIGVQLTPGAKRDTFVATVKTYNGEELSLDTEEKVQPIVEALNKATYCVSDITRKTTRRSPQAPFRTSTMQRAAASHLRFSARKTMTVAQGLYEGVETSEGTVGLITYMRTDSTRVSAEAQGQAREYIKSTYGEEFVGEGVTDKKRKGVQDAHEGIRPTDVERTPESVAKYLDKDQANLYELIWRQFVASQMTAAVYKEVGVDIAAGAYGLHAGGAVLDFPGYLAVQPQERDETEAGVLRELKKQQELELIKVNPEQHFTKPPPRFTEASLVRALEENGIGRPSTYAPTIDTLRQRKYVRMQQRTFIPTQLGFVVNDYLLANFPEIVDVEFTANIENQLDTVQEGKLKWQKLIRDFYEDFDAQIDTASESAPRVLEGELCPKCQGKLLERFTLSGKFAGCENYPECDYTRDLLADVLPQQEVENVGRDCPDCGKPLVYRLNRRGQKFIGCTGYPECEHTEALDSDGNPKPPAKETDVECPKCGAKMLVRHGRRGPFLGCSTFPKCRGILPIEALEGGDVEIPEEARKAEPEQLGEDCPDCGKPLLIRSGRRGKFIACSGYPKCRYTRNIDEPKDESSDE